MCNFTFDEFSAALSAELIPSLRGCENHLSRFTKPETVERLYKISAKLVENGRKFNLTSILDLDGIVRKHIIDSLLPLGQILDLGFMPRNALDVGSGGGFPCLPMAAATVGECAFTALDATRKKISHILECAAEANIPSLSAVSGRAEELSRGEMREKYDLVTARAVASLPILLELCAPFVTPGGIFAALKANVDDELRDGDRAAEILGMTNCATVRYVIPGGDERTLVVYRKLAETKQKYPRSYSEISKRPLK